MSAAPPRVLIRAWCPCGLGVRRVLPTTPCPRCGRQEWKEKHEPAFHEILQRGDGWYGRSDYSADWVGPFTTRELAASVRYDHAPGYLLCGLCGFDDLQEHVVAHYVVTHPALDELLGGEDLADVKEILR